MLDLCRSFRFSTSNPRFERFEVTELESLKSDIVVSVSFESFMLRYRIGAAVDD